MIHTNKLPVFPKCILCTAVYYEQGVPKMRSQFAATDERADGVLKKFCKEILAEKITKYLNHRQQIMDHHGGLRTMETAQTYEQLKTLWAYISDKSLERICEWTINHKTELLSLAPGTKSLYYETHQKFLTDLFAFCKTKTSTNVF